MTIDEADECFACGKTLAEHADQLPANGMRPRMPCLGLKEGFRSRTRTAIVAVGCPLCRQYRDALRAIVTGANSGVRVEALADLARIALLAPEIHQFHLQGTPR